MENLTIENLKTSSNIIIQTSTQEEFDILLDIFEIDNLKRENWKNYKQDTYIRVSYETYSGVSFRQELDKLHSFAEFVEQNKDTLIEMGYECKLVGYKVIERPPFSPWSVGEIIESEYMFEECKQNPQYCSPIFNINKKFKVGDIIYIEGCEGSHNLPLSKGGDVCKIDEIDEIWENIILCDIDNNRLRCEMSKESWKGYKVRKASPTEIENYKKINISGYLSKVKDNKINFGCQAFNKIQLESIESLLSRPIKVELKINDVEITGKMVEKLLKQLK